MNLVPLILTLQLALVTTVVLFALTIPLAYWLAYSRSRFRAVVKTLVSMPLVLPPTVIGFYLLLVFSPNSAVGAWLANAIGIQLAFSFTGLVVGSIIYSLPFMVHPVLAGFESVSSNVIEASWTMGKSRYQTLVHIILPLSKPALITGAVLAFAHTIGEFGVVLMIGGGIPGRTRVASVAIYEEVEALNYAGAHVYSLVLFVTTFIILIAVYSINKGRTQRLIR